MAHALICPQCNAPLKPPSRFARTVTCSYCGTTVKLDASTTVSIETFHKAYRSWNSPQSYAVPAWLSLGDHHWAVDELLASGSVCDVYRGMRARFPTELVILKVLRDQTKQARLDNEWNILQALQKSASPGAETFARLLPEPVMHGHVTANTFEGRRVTVIRWASGFHHTFEAVQRAYPKGIPPRASIWVWRRILEALSFIHVSGIVHGAVLPQHLLVQDNEHGVRLVDYGAAGYTSQKLQFLTEGCDAFYPAGVQIGSTLTQQLDLVMSARCIMTILGGRPADAFLPASVPVPLAALVRRVATSDPSSNSERAWSLREELGRLADTVFGAPQFNPIVMPS